jgi:hypothetical protein
MLAYTSYVYNPTKASGYVVRSGTTDLAILLTSWTQTGDHWLCHDITGGTQVFSRGAPVILTLTSSKVKHVHDIGRLRP